MFVKYSLLLKTSLEKMKMIINMFKSSNDLNRELLNEQIDGEKVELIDLSNNDKYLPKKLNSILNTIQDVVTRLKKKYFKSFFELFFI